MKGRLICYTTEATDRCACQVDASKFWFYLSIKLNLIVQFKF